MLIGITAAAADVVVVVVAVVAVCVRVFSQKEKKRSVFVRAKHSVHTSVFSQQLRDYHSYPTNDDDNSSKISVATLKFHCSFQWN